MNLYLLYQDENSGYDTYDLAVVAAESEQSAKEIHPSDYGNWSSNTWASSPENVSVQFIGTAAKGINKGVVLASFNAG